MDLNQAVELINGQQRFGWRLELERVERALRDLQQPQAQYPSLIIAGTNGKGSVAAMLDMMLRSQQIKTGLYTSPHLCDIRERIRINGEKIDPRLFVLVVEAIAEKLLAYRCTYFESITLVAFVAFARARIDLAILEVGLGGRFDATNAATPVFSIITNVDFDHTAYLGNSKEKIALEKAGVIKANSTCLVGKLDKKTETVIRKKCTEQSTRFCRASDYGAIGSLRLKAEGSEFLLHLAGQRHKVKLSLAGPHQVRNFLLAANALEFVSGAGFHVSMPKALAVVEHLKWPGRFEIICRRPFVIFDVAHNAAAIKTLTWMIKRFFKRARCVYVVGLLKDKDAAAILPILLARGDEFYFVALPTPRTKEPIELQQHFEALGGKAEVAESTLAAVKAGRSDSIICITGSHYHAEAVEKIKTLTF